MKRTLAATLRQQAICRNSGAAAPGVNLVLWLYSLRASANRPKTAASRDPLAAIR